MSHTHTRTHTFCFFSSLLSDFLLSGDTQEKEGTGERGSEDASRHRHRLQQRQQQYHTVCLGVSASVCECMCVCVCLGACVRCVSQDCQHISSQREPYRNRDICGVKGRQLAWPSLEKEEDGRRRGEKRSRKRKRNGQEDGGESAGAPNLVCQTIIRGGVLFSLDRDENV